MLGEGVDENMRFCHLSSYNNAVFSAKFLRNFAVL